MAPTSENFFNWVDQDVLAAMAWPRNLRKAFEHFQEEGISVVVSLTETPLNKVFVDEFGFEYHHLPLADFAAPDYDMIRRFVGIVSEAKRAGKKTVVHCLAGRGRTGTLAACYLVSLGLSSREALARIRHLRPGSVETPEQEDAIHEYAFRSRHEGEQE